MRKLATWASTHRRPARLLVILCYILVNVAGVALCIFLPQDSRIPAWLVFGALVLSGWCITASGREERSNSFRSRKVRDLSFCLATLMFVCGNAGMQLQPAPERSAVVSSVWGAMMPVRASAAHSRFNLREKLIAARQWYAGQTSGTKVLLIALAVLGTAALIFLWAAVCCGIICNGLEALGYILFFAGTAGAVFGCVKIIQRILRGPRARSAG